MVCGDWGKQWPSDFQHAFKEHLLCAEVCCAVEEREVGCKSDAWIPILLLPDYAHLPRR